MIHKITTPFTFRSSLELKTYLNSIASIIATNREVPAEELLPTTMPRWEQGPQGCITMFEPLIITNEVDAASPVGKMILPDPARSPILSHFFSGMCYPFSFELEEMPIGTIIFVKR
jgi:hypothetical protein